MSRKTGKRVSTTPRAKFTDTSSPKKKNQADRRANEKRLDEEYGPDELPIDGKAPTPEQHLNFINELGINFSKLGYKPRPAFCAKGETPYYAIQQLASLGLTQRQVHLSLGWSEDTWAQRKKNDPRIMEEYEMGYSRGVTMVANRHFTAAMQGSIPAMQFILRTKGGFTEPKEDKIGPQELAAAIRNFLAGVDSTTGLPGDGGVPKPEGE